MRLPGHVIAVDPANAARSDVLEEALVERAAEAAPAVVRAGRDHVDVGLVGVVRADEPDEEADDRPGRVLGHPRRPVKCWNHSRGSSWWSRRPPHHSSTDPDQEAVVGLDRAAERGVASVIARVDPGDDPGDAANSSEDERARRPRRGSRAGRGRRPRTGAKSQRPSCPSATDGECQADRQPRPAAPGPCLGRHRPAGRAATAQPAAAGDDDQPGRDRQDTAEDGDAPRPRPARPRRPRATPRAAVRGRIVRRPGRGSAPRDSGRTAGGRDDARPGGVGRAVRRRLGAWPVAGRVGHRCHRTVAGRPAADRRSNRVAGQRRA